jgi:hypothetical protein
MPLDGSDNASPVPGSNSVAPNTTIASALHNSMVDDIYAILNSLRAFAHGSTGITTGSQFGDINNANSIANLTFLDWSGRVAAAGTTSLTATLNRAYSAYGASAGQLGNGTRIAVKMANAASGATTMTVSSPSSLGSKKVLRNDGTAIQSGDWPAGATVDLRYDTALDTGTGAWALVMPAVPAGISAASTTETITGTSTAKYVTPDSLAALWEAGADNTDGATITMGEGGYFNLITSTTSITAFAFTTDKAGRTANIRFNTARTLTHNGTSLIIPGGANITTAAGDIMGIRSLGSGNFVVEWYTKADGTPLVGGTEYTQQPTSDVATISQTGLLGHKFVEFAASFTVNTSVAGSAGIIVSARVSGGTYRTLATFTSASLSGATSTIVAHVRGRIWNFNSAVEKPYEIRCSFSAEDATIDSSNAPNAVSSTASTAVDGFASWDEIWDDIQLSGADKFANFEGSTTDQRGRMTVVGF